MAIRRNYGLPFYGSLFVFYAKEQYPSYHTPETFASQRQE